MDNTIDHERIAEALKNLDRHKQHEHSLRSNAESLNVASAIGTDTPLTLLNDIRQIMSELLVATKRNNDMMIEMIEKSVVMHRESLAYMQQITDSVNAQRGAIPTTGPSQRISLSPEKSDTYYYRGDPIKRSESVIACIFLHLDSMISKASPPETGGIDTTVMELKEWASAVKILKDAESAITETKGKLKIPTLSSHECKHALDIVASPIQGRMIACKIEHLINLTNNCPALMNCVEELRVRSLECPGIISLSRSKRLASISFPYATVEGSLNITNSNPKVSGSRIVFDRVKTMKEPQKKAYVNAILKDGVKPMNASSIALQSRTDES